MTSPLPERPNIEHLRKQAKQLLKAHKAGDPSACSTLRRLHRFTNATDEQILAAPFTLKEVQFALALSYGFRNWDHLKAYVESVTPLPAHHRLDIEVGPIRRDELDRIVLRCWPPDRDELLRLIDEQETIGMAAWEGSKNVGVVHGYRIDDLRAGNAHWPSWSSWWRPESWPTETREAAFGLPGPIWCLACIHVGRTLASDREEMLQLVRRFALQNAWDPKRTTAALNALDAVNMELQQVEVMLAKLRRIGSARFVEQEPRYYSQGIGTSLCKCAVQWARDHGYATVAGIGAPTGLFEFATWIGRLPYTTYAKLGFRVLGPMEPQDNLPEWARGDSPPEVMRQVEEAQKQGRTAESFHERVMAAVL